MIVIRAASVAREQPSASGQRALTVEQGPTSSARSLIVVTGPVHEAHFPPLCARCGSAAKQTLSIQKLFWHSGGDEGSPYHVLGEVDAPFCERCLALHAREAQPMDSRIKQKLFRGWLLNALPFLFPVGVLLFMFMVAVRATLAALADRVSPWQVAAPAGIAVFFAWCVFGFYRGFRRHGNQLIHERQPRSPRVYVQIERGPLGSRFIVEMEPTVAQLAVDFSDDVSAPFEGERHQFTFQNTEMAERFRELNAGRAWSPTSRRARFATAAQFTVILAIALVLVYALIFDRG